MTKILMVCMGNICRSPMAGAVAEHMTQAAGLSGELSFDSAGTHADHIGRRPDPRARMALTNRGIRFLNTRSRKVTEQDFLQFDLILAMDRSNLAALQCQCPPQYFDKLRLLLEFSEDASDQEVPDPYYGNFDGFERVLDLCEAGVKGLIKAQA